MFLSLLLLFISNTHALDFQFGNEAAVTDAWSTVTIDSSIASPVVIALPATINEDFPCVVQVRNVVVGSFEIRLIETNDGDITHLAE